MSWQTRLLAFPATMSDTDFCFSVLLALVGVSSPPLLLFLRLRFLGLVDSSLLAFVVAWLEAETEEDSPELMQPG